MMSEKAENRRWVFEEAPVAQAVFTMAIPTIITQIASGARQIKLGAMQPTRDFNYVFDTVSGFIAIAEADGAVGQIVNIGSNFEISIGDTAKLIAEQMDREVEFTLDERRLRPADSEVDRLWADNTRARELAGWTPGYGGRDGFGRGLRETIAWFSAAGNLRRYRAELYNI